MFCCGTLAEVVLVSTDFLVAIAGQGELLEGNICCDLKCSRAHEAVVHILDDLASTFKRNRISPECNVF